MVAAAVNFHSPIGQLIVTNSGGGGGSFGGSS